MMARKGIVPAGGTGSRLRPLVIPACRQFLPVHDKPMIGRYLHRILAHEIKEDCAQC